MVCHGVLVCLLSLCISWCTGVFTLVCGMWWCTGVFTLVCGMWWCTGVFTLVCGMSWCTGVFTSVCGMSWCTGVFILVCGMSWCTGVFTSVCGMSWCTGVFTLVCSMSWCTGVFTLVCGMSWCTGVFTFVCSAQLIDFQIQTVRRTTIRLLIKTVQGDFCFVRGHRPVFCQGSPTCVFISFYHLFWRKLTLKYSLSFISQTIQILCSYTRVSFHHLHMYNNAAGKQLEIETVKTEML